MVFQWNLNGISALRFFNISVGPQWNLHGTSMEPQWNLNDKSALRFLKTSIGPQWDFKGTSSTRPQNLARHRIERHIFL
eukprot:9478823-Pyramimonas_sp.AAC.2